MSRPLGVRNVIVVVRHPHGDLETSLAQWIATGPGPRFLLRPIAAKDGDTGRPLPFSIIPLRYRNNVLSRTLIRLRLVRNPWKPQT